MTVLIPIACVVGWLLLGLLLVAAYERWNGHNMKRLDRSDPEDRIMVCVVVILWPVFLVIIAALAVGGVVIAAIDRLAGR